eukprot:gene12259-12397_t
MGHPKRWGERPLLVVVPQPAAAGNDAALRQEVMSYMHSHPAVAKFARPDDVVVLPEIPHTATGKVSKLTLRKMFKDYKPSSSTGSSSGGRTGPGIMQLLTGEVAEMERVLIRRLGDHARPVLHCVQELQEKLMMVVTTAAAAAGGGGGLGLPGSAAQELEDFGVAGSLLLQLAVPEEGLEGA